MIVTLKVVPLEVFRTFSVDILAFSVMHVMRTEQLSFSTTVQGFDTFWTRDITGSRTIQNDAYEHNKRNE